MSRYYNLIQYSKGAVHFHDRFGREHQIKTQDFLSRGLLEFFHPDDAKRIVQWAQLDAEGDVLSRLDKGQLWVPYRRYAYFPFFAFIAMAAQVLASLMCMKPVVIFDHTFFGSFLILPFAFVATDLVNELYGYKATRRMIRQCAGAIFLVAASLLLLKHWAVDIASAHNNAWMFVMRAKPETLVFYAVSLITADNLNAWLFHRLRFLLTNRGFWLRSIVSTSISRIIYSTVTVTLFYFTGPYAQHRSTYNTQYFNKVFASVEFSVMYIVCLMLPMYLICHFIRKQDFRPTPNPKLQPHFL